MAAIPQGLFGAAGMLVNGYVTDWLVKGEWLRLKAGGVRSALLPARGCSAAFTLVATASDNIHDSGYADWRATVLYSLCRNILLAA